MNKIIILQCILFNVIFSDVIHYHYYMNDNFNETSNNQINCYLSSYGLGYLGHYGNKLERLPRPSE